MWVEAEYKEQLDKYSTDKFTVTVGFDRFVGNFFHTVQSQANWSFYFNFFSYSNGKRRIRGNYSHLDLICEIKELENPVYGPVSRHTNFFI